jgi:AcrR family transcriptional regulator
VPRAGLTPSSVVAEAATAADEVGFDQLTLASVAQRLGVALPSLYKHVRGLADLQRLIATQAMRELSDVMTKAAVGKSGADALHSVAHAYREYARQHPGRYASTLRASDAGDAERNAAAAEAVDVVYAILEGYRIRADDAVDATRMLRAMLHGFVALEAAGGFGMPRAVGRSFDRAVDALDVALSNWR